MKKAIIAKSSSDDGDENVKYVSDGQYGVCWTSNILEAKIFKSLSSATDFIEWHQCYDAKAEEKMSNATNEFDVKKVSEETAIVTGILSRDGSTYTFEKEVPWHGSSEGTLHEFTASGGELDMWKAFNRKVKL